MSSDTTFQAALSEALAAISRHTHLQMGETKLVVAISGGPDSLALLHGLRHLLLPEQLVIAHLDHQLRPESVDEARYVRHTASTWGLTTVVKSVDVAEWARSQQLSIEEAGRQARYAFLADTARATGASAVVTGHHADDQAETILMHILRGSGLDGLRGMLPAMRLLDAPDIWLLRPLLGVSRETIVTYCAANRLAPLTDASNTDPAYFRNRLRHELLPLLETYNPTIRTRLAQLSAVVAADAEWLSLETSYAFGRIVVDSGPGWVLLDRRAWQALHLSLRRRTLRLAIETCAPDQRDVGFATLEAARTSVEAGGSGRRADLPGDVVLHVNAETLLLATGPDFPASLGPQLAEDQVATLPIPGHVALAGGWTLVAERVDRSSLPELTGSDPWSVHIGLDSQDPLTVRGRIPGERLEPLGLGGQHVTLKEMMIDRKLPAQLRRNWPLVTANDQVIWLVGHALDHRYRVTAASKYIIRLHCRRTDTRL